jgi:DNA-binding NtrC family response regulator
MPSPSPLTILVAEDDDGVRNLILAALARSGHTVMTVANGREAMEVLGDQSHVIDVLVSDVNMPVVGGLELLEFARSTRPGLAVILASGTNRWELPADRIDANVALLEKPFTIIQLSKAIDQALG